jgi:glutamate-1-semialdehyde aminotransferase
MKHTFLAVALLSVAALVHAETNPAKKELLNKVVQLQQPMVEATARQLAEQSIAQLVQQVGSAMQFRVPPEKREALAKDIQADVKKYADEVIPLLRERASKLAPVTLTAVLDSKFTEDELRQLVVLLESPVLRKYSQAVPDFQKALVEKLVADSKGQIEPKLKALGQSVEKRINTAAPAQPASK